MARLNVFAKPKEALAARDNYEGFRVSAFTVVVYIAHEVDPGGLDIALSSGKLTTIGADRSADDDLTYRDKLKKDGALRYSTKLPIHADDFFASALPQDTGYSGGPVPVSHNLVWVEGSPTAISVVPVKFLVKDLRDADNRAFTAVVKSTCQLDRPITIDQLLRTISAITRSDCLRVLELCSAASVEDVAGVQARNSRTVEGTIGTYIWSIAGSIDRDSTIPYDGVLDSQRYSWPLSALLEYTSDHIRRGFQSDRSVAQVFSSIGEGYCFMSDHAIFANNACCLEITHFGTWSGERSWVRLDQYGYDSSSLYLWAVALARNSSYRAIAADYGHLIGILTSPLTAESFFGDDYFEMSARTLRHIDALDGLHFSLQEARSQEIDAVFSALLGDAPLRAAARSRVDTVRLLLDQKRELVEDHRRQTVVVVVTLAAAILALAAIPSAVEQFAEWMNEGLWLRVGVTCVVIALAALAVILAVRGWPFDASPKTKVDVEQTDE